ncbi:MAG: DUF2269 family protein [Nitrososphaeraceae archaeon]
MSRLIFSSVINFLHLFATVAWFGAMTTNAFILLPSARETLEAPVAGKLMGAVMRRFRILVYTSIAVLVVTGIGMTRIIENSMKFMQFTNLWSTISSIKHIFVIIVVVLVIYAFEGLGRRVSRLAKKGPSPELAQLQKKQIMFSYIGLVLAFIILLLTGILTAI